MTLLALPLLPLVGAGLLVALRRRARLLGPVAVGVLVATLALGGAAAALLGRERFTPARLAGASLVAGGVAALALAG